mgnify:CR=1 FL=1|jgi:hypothetical protein
MYLKCINPIGIKSLVIASLFKDKNTNSSRPVFIRIQIEKDLKVILEKNRKAAN